MWGLVFLRLGVSKSHVLGVSFLTFGVSKSNVWVLVSYVGGLGILTFEG